MTYTEENDLLGIDDADRMITITVPDGHNGERLDAFLAAVSASSDLAALTRSAIARLCDDGAVTVSNKKAQKSLKLHSGDIITMHLPEPTPDIAMPENIPLDIVYEDSDLIVINKPQGMVVHPAAGNPNGTLVNALLYHCGNSLSGIGGVLRPGIVHRIDKDTSGLLVVAKNDFTHTALAADIKIHDVKRTYAALLCGNPREDSGTVDAPLGRNPTDRKKMAIIRDRSQNSRNAVTHWKVAERYCGCSLVICRLETGRTHQIRVHMASIGHPVLGDPIYGGETGSVYSQNASIICGQCLHAARLELTHPRSKERMTFSAPCPQNMQTITDRLRKEAGTQTPYISIKEYTEQ